MIKYEGMLTVIYFEEVRIEQRKFKLMQQGKSLCFKYELFLSDTGICTLCY